MHNPIIGNKDDYNRDNTLLNLFYDAVKRHGNKIAIEHCGISVSMLDVYELAVGFASSIQKIGLQKGEFVPVILDNCLELPIAYLGLMMNGLPFIPMSPFDPENRLEKLILDIDPKLIVTKKNMCNIRSNIFRIDINELPRGKSIISTVISGDDPIYGFFTSGSTGKPKCAINLHKGIYNRIQYMNKRFNLSSDDVILHNSHPIFDPSIWQIFVSLTNAATLIMPKEEERIRLDYIIDLIDTKKVTVTDFVPSVFDLMVDYCLPVKERRDKLRTLNYLFIGGEEMTPKAVYLFKAFFSTTTIINTYGPTEASIGTVFYKVDEKRFNPIPIGSPIDNVDVVVKNSKGELCGYNENGELYLGGVCLGSGYLNEPKLTEAAFIKNTYSEIDSDCLYKTGDVVYYSDDGNLYFVGRKDSQIKLNGVRIELNEIQIALASTPGVKKARVIYLSNDIKMMFAIIEKSENYYKDEIIKSIEQTFPRTMIPDKIIFVDRMPVNSIGKIDKNALQKCALESMHEYATQQLESKEQTLCKSLFSEILHQSEIGLDDDFFTIGGNSLNAIRLINMLNSYGYNITVNQFLNNATIRRLASNLNAKCLTNSQNDYEKIQLFENDLSLDNAVNMSVRTHKRHEKGKGVFITGSTGFLGAEIVKKYLEEDCYVFALARKSDNKDGYSRVIENLEKHLWNGANGHRLRIFEGDIAKSNYGLAKKDYEYLCKETEVIINAATNVNLFMGYEQLRADNVLSMKNIIEFAYNSRCKKIVHISSLCVADEVQFDEEALAYIEPLKYPHGGYAQTKWMQERFISLAVKRGINGIIVRFGEIFPNTKTGIINENSLLTMLVSMCIDKKIIPFSSGFIGGTPVDIAANIVYELCIRNSAVNKIFNVDNLEVYSWREFLENKLYGHTYEYAKFNEFRTMLEETIPGFKGMLENQNINDSNWLDKIFTNKEIHRKDDGLLRKIYSSIKERNWEALT